MRSRSREAAALSLSGTPGFYIERIIPLSLSYHPYRETRIENYGEFKKDEHAESPDQAPKISLPYRPMNNITQAPALQLGNAVGPIAANP